MKGPAFTPPLEIGVYIKNRLFNEALAELEKAKRERKSDPILIYSTGMVYAAQGKRAEALQIIKELEEMSGASQSQAHHRQNLCGLEREGTGVLVAGAWLSNGSDRNLFKDEPVWDTIRSDPRFDDLLRRMDLTL